jgi:hypothetical protein
MHALAYHPEEGPAEGTEFVILRPYNGRRILIIRSLAIRICRIN